MFAASDPVYTTKTLLVWVLRVCLCVCVLTLGITLVHSSWLICRYTLLKKLHITSYKTIFCSCGTTEIIGPLKRFKESLLYWK